MSEKDEVLKIAKYVLECYNQEIPTNAAKEAIQACKEALTQPVCSKCGKPTQQGECFYGCRQEQPAQEPVAFDCKNCHACLKGVKGETGYPITMTRMIVCPDCGNKRCPKATDHRHFCTNSNDTNQAGSIYNTHPAPSWQGLSDDEITKVFDDIGVSTTHRKIYLAIEQALKEKNHGA